MRVTRKSDIRRALAGGVVAGLVGGAALSAFMTLPALATGNDPWGSVKLAGAPLLGTRALQSGFDGLAVAVGLVMHFAVSAAWGALFGILFAGAARTAVVTAGVVWGVVVWLAMFHVVLPALGMAALVAQVPRAVAVAQHVVYGLTTAVVFLPFRQRRTLVPGLRIELRRSVYRVTGTDAP
jgi:hypothetical protein